MSDDMVDGPVYLGTVRQNADGTIEAEKMPPLRERDHILNQAKRLISGEREKQYGDAVENFTRIGRLWAPILGVDEVTPEQAALCLTALKISRLCHEPTHHDSWVDACGYMALGGDIATRSGRVV